MCLPPLFNLPSLSVSASISSFLLFLLASADALFRSFLEVFLSSTLHVALAVWIVAIWSSSCLLSGMCEDDLQIVEVVSRFDRSREARCFLLSDGHVANVVGASVESFSIALGWGWQLSRGFRCDCFVSFVQFRPQDTGSMAQYGMIGM